MAGFGEGGGGGAAGWRAAKQTHFSSELAVRVGMRGSRPVKLSRVIGRGVNEFG